MAFVLHIACALLAGMSLWMLLGGGLGGTRAVTARIAMLHHTCGRVLERIASTAAIERLLGNDTFRALAERMLDMISPGYGELSLAGAGTIVLMMLAGITCLGARVSRSFVGAAATLTTCVMGAHAWASSRRHKRRRELSSSMPGVLRTMATALESGQTLSQAVEYVGLHEHGPAAESFARASLRLRCGMSLASTLADLERELEVPGMDLVVTALLVSQRTGSPLRALLLQLADLVEQQEEFERLLAVRTAQVRLSVRIVSVLPPLMVCLLALISPDFQKGILSAPGIASLLIAACLDGVALLLIRTMMRRALPWA